jgi:hypothetical protein
MGRSRIDRQEYPIQLRQAIAGYLPRQGLGLIAGGNQRWSDRLLVMVAILLVWSGLPTLKDRFAEARRAGAAMYPSRRRTGRSYAGFIGKLHRHSRRLLGLVIPTLRGHVKSLAGEHWKVGRFVAFGVDGTKSDAPRTKANRCKLKIGGKRRSGPQQLLVSLMHVGTGLIWSWNSGEATASERALLLEQLGTLPGGSLLLMDAGFTGYECLKTILAAGHQVLVRAGANVTLIKELGWVLEEKGHLACLWPNRARESGGEPLVFREIMVIDGRNRRMCLLVSVLDQEQFSDEEAIRVYAKRWGIELLYRGLKQTLGRRKMLSDSPQNAQVELEWTMVGYWVLCLMLWEHRGSKAAATTGVADGLRLVREAMRGQVDRRVSFIARWRRLEMDTYLRPGPRASADWPHKKNEPPCGTPEIRMATSAEVCRAKRLLSLRPAA